MLTNVLKYDIIVKLSREIPSQRRQRTLKIVSVAKGKTGTFSSLLKSLAGSDSFLKKLFQKTSKKYLTNRKRHDIITKLSPRATHEKLRAKRMTQRKLEN